MRFPITTMLLVSSLAAASVLSSAACQRSAEASRPSVPAASDDGSLGLAEDSPLRQKLVVTAVEIREVRPQLLAPGTVEADPARLAKVVSPLTGQVKRLLVRQGELVTKGQALLVMDAPDLVAARADLLRARSVFVQADHAYRRTQDLLAHAVAAQRDLEEAETSFAVARDDLERATQRLRLLGVDSGALDAPLTVRSPLSGQVLSLATAPGEDRNDSTTPLLVVADLTNLWVTANVPERDMEKVRVGDAARIQV